MPRIKFGGNGPALGGHINFGGSPISAQAPDPLADVDYTGNREEDAGRELTAMEKAYRKRAKNEEKRVYDATDSEYWVAVCFRSREAKEAYLRAIDAIDIGDKYIDGHQLARRQGIDLDSTD